MGEKRYEPERFFIDGKEIQGISESELTYCENDTLERDCEITTTKGTIHFKAVFTREQWAEFEDVVNAVKAGED